jgi:hypothetical protein
MEEIDKEISEMKITLNARARIVAEEFLKNVCQPFIDAVYFIYMFLPSLPPPSSLSPVLSVSTCYLSVLNT